MMGGFRSFGSGLFYNADSSRMDEQKEVLKGAMGNMAEEQVKKNLLTRAGLNKYEAELHDLKVNKRQMIAEKIKEAREQQSTVVKALCLLVAHTCDLNCSY